MQCFVGFVVFTLVTVGYSQTFDELLPKLNSHSESERMKAAVALGALEAVSTAQINRLVLAATGTRRRDIRVGLYRESRNGVVTNFRGTGRAYATAVLVMLGERAAPRLIEIYEKNWGYENCVRVAFFVLNQMRIEYVGDSQFENAELATRVYRIVRRDRNRWSRRGLPLISIPRTPPPRR